MMSMVSYVGEVEYAVTETLASLWRDRDALDHLSHEIARLESAVRAGYRQAAAIAMDPLDDDEGLATMIHWETYFGPDKERHAAAQARDDIETRRLARAFSLDALAATLLQYAKQGISLTHGNLAACPDGRPIDSQPLKQVIWQGRNQAIHWEEGIPRPAVADCFETLRIEIDQKFGQYRLRNLAFDIIELLGWRSFSDFATDLRLLA